MSLPISYPWRARLSTSDRINSSALPFLSSRSNIGDSTYAIAIYCYANGRSASGRAGSVLEFNHQRLEGTIHQVVFLMFGGGAPTGFSGLVDGRVHLPVRHGQPRVLFGQVGRK